MFAYTVQRLFVAVPTLFLIIAMAFFMLKAAPGDPFTSDRALPPEIERNLEAKYGLDRPLHEQFTTYVGNVLSGDLGPSFKNKDFSVNEMIGLALPVSIRIGLFAITLAVGFGLVFGTLAALNQNTLSDYTIMGIALAGLALPAFVIGPLLQLFFGLQLNILPVGGWDPGDISKWVLPAVTLSLLPLATVSRLTRGSMIEILRSNYVRTARAKGLPPHVVIGRHALRAAIVPLVAYLPIAVAQLLTGSLVVETVFNLPGTGQLFVRSALDRDYTLVMGLVILFAGLIITLNLISDLVIAVLDPKVRLSG